MRSRIAGPTAARIAATRASSSASGPAATSIFRQVKPAATRRGARPRRRLRAERTDAALTGYRGHAAGRVGCAEERGDGAAARFADQIVSGEVERARGDAGRGEVEVGEGSGGVVGGEAGGGAARWRRGCGRRRWRRAEAEAGQGVASPTPKSPPLASRVMIRPSRWVITPCEVANGRTKGTRTRTQVAR
ncbi:MAG: hypothetical protein U0841_28280 [Chloroflexia bacterium]